MKYIEVSLGKHFGLFQVPQNVTTKKRVCHKKTKSLTILQEIVEEMTIDTEGWVVELGQSCQGDQVLQGV